MRLNLIDDSQLSTSYTLELFANKYMDSKKKEKGNVYDNQY